MLPALLVAAFLGGHALIHAGFLSPRPTTANGPAWPFGLDRSWLLDRFGAGPSATHAIGRALVLALFAGYALAIAATLGLLGGPAFAWGVAVGSAASFALLAAFFHRWLVVGLALDVLLLVAVVAGWTVESAG